MLDGKKKFNGANCFTKKTSGTKETDAAWRVNNKYECSCIF